MVPRIASIVCPKFCILYISSFLFTPILFCYNVCKFLHNFFIQFHLSYLSGIIFNPLIASLLQLLPLALQPRQFGKINSFGFVFHIFSLVIEFNSENPQQLNAVISSANFDKQNYYKVLTIYTNFERFGL